MGRGAGLPTKAVCKHRAALTAWAGSPLIFAQLLTTASGRFCCNSRPAPSFTFGVLPRIDCLIQIGFLREIAFLRTPPREMLFYVFAERLCIEGSPGSFATQSPHIHRSWRRSDSVVFSCVDNLVGRRTLDHSGCGQNLIVATYQATRELPNLAR